MAKRCVCDAAAHPTARGDPGRSRSVPPAPPAGFSRDVRAVAPRGLQSARHAVRALVYSPPSGLLRGPLPCPCRVPTPKESMTPGLTPQLARDWASIRSELRSAVPDSTFEIWLAPLSPRAFADGTLVVQAPDEIRSWVADRFARVLQTCAAAVLGPETLVDLVAPGAAVEDATARTAKPSEPACSEPEFHPKLTFDQFVIGDSNRFAHAAALAVAELPGQAYNPLFLYGPPGLGKTHLLHAIGNYVQEHGGGLRVRCTTAERFTN